MLEINVNVRFPDLLGILEQLKQNLPKQNLPVLNDLVNRQPEVSNVIKEETPVLSAVINAEAPTPTVTLTQAKPEPELPKAETPTYTLPQVARAGADLLTAKPALQPKLVELLSKYGAQTVVELKPEHLAAFAEDLRGLGAKI